MTNKSLVFSSSLASIFEGYVAEKHALGNKYKKGTATLKRLDNLLIRENVTDKSLSKEIVLLWTAKNKTETDSNRGQRISIVRGVAQYMVKLGYDAYVFPGRATFVDRYNYVPYIFSEQELKALFIAVDNTPVSSVSPYRHLALPLLFRMLYGCGLRISEALNLKRTDVNLGEGILTIHQAKLGKQRLVPMADTLVQRCRGYSRLAHNDGLNDAHFFLTYLGDKYSTAYIYDYFRKCLWKAGISHGGRGRGPRLHDLRHTFSVHCLKKWVLRGNDLTNLLPYLSAYLGHVDLRSSQHYLRLTADLYPNLLAKVQTQYPDLIPEVESHETN